MIIPKEFRAIVDIPDKEDYLSTHHIKVEKDLITATDSYMLTMIELPNNYKDKNEFPEIPEGFKIVSDDVVFIDRKAAKEFIKGNKNNIGNIITNGSKNYLYSKNKLTPIDPSPTAPEGFPKKENIDILFPPENNGVFELSVSVLSQLFNDLKAVGIVTVEMQIPKEKRGPFILRGVSESGAKITQMFMGVSS